MVFSGTIRYNLDPHDEHDDQALRDALERVHLVDAGKAIMTPSSHTVTPVLANNILVTSLHQVTQVAVITRTFLPRYHPWCLKKGRTYHKVRDSFLVLLERSYRALRS